MIKKLAKELYLEEPRQGTLYHYTSLESLMKIVESGYLYATEIRFFSDASEMQHTEKLLRTAIAERVEYGASNHKLLNQLKEWLPSRLNSGHMIYISSFTENGNLLSQWRSYCDPTSGVSIGFNAVGIFNAAKNQTFQIGKCIYEYERQKKIVETILDEITEIANERGENEDSSKRHPTQSFHDVFEDIEADLLGISALLKHPSFCEEEEWRAVSPNISNYVKAPIEYRVGRSMLIPYLKFQLPVTASKRIELEHVFVGPTPNINNSMTSLSRYLSKKGVSPSKGTTYCQIPYRTW